MRCVTTWDSESSDIQHRPKTHLQPTRCRQVFHQILYYKETRPTYPPFDTFGRNHRQAFVNIPNYPEQNDIDAQLQKLPKVAKLDIEQIAKDLGSSRSANVVLLGMAAPYIGILTTQQLRDAVARVFARKGEAVVEANLKAFDAGVAAVQA